VIEVVDSVILNAAACSLHCSSSFFRSLSAAFLSTLGSDAHDLLGSRALLRLFTVGMSSGKELGPHQLRTAQRFAFPPHVQEGGNPRMEFGNFNKEKGGEWGKGPFIVGQIQILAAFYGNANVSENVKRMVAAGLGAIRASSFIFGDPLA